MRKMYIDAEEISKDWGGFQAQSVQNNKRIK